MNSNTRNPNKDTFKHGSSDGARGGFKNNRGKFEKKNWKSKDGKGGKEGGFGQGGGKRKAGNMRNQAKLLEYKKFLPLCIDKKLQIKLTCDRFVVGTLDGYDTLENITLANAIDKETNERLGTIMIRGAAIERIEALEDLHKNPDFSRLGVSSHT